MIEKFFYLQGFLLNFPLLQGYSNKFLISLAYAFAIDTSINLDLYTAIKAFFWGYLTFLPLQISWQSLQSMIGYLDQARGGNLSSLYDFQLGTSSSLETSIQIFCSYLYIQKTGLFQNLISNQNYKISSHVLLNNITESLTVSFQIILPILLIYIITDLCVMIFIKILPSLCLYNESFIFKTVFLLQFIFTLKLQNIIKM